MKTALTMRLIGILGVGLDDTMLAFPARGRADHLLSSQMVCVAAVGPENSRKSKPERSKIEAFRFYRESDLDSRFRGNDNRVHNHFPNNPSLLAREKKMESIVLQVERAGISLASSYAV